MPGRHDPIMAVLSPSWEHVHLPPPPGQLAEAMEPSLHDPTQAHPPLESPSQVLI